MTNRKPDDEFIAKRSKKKDAVQIIPPTQMMKSGYRPDILLPDIFDEDRLRQDLERYQSAPSLFSSYVERMRIRFARKGEIAVLDKWVEFYRKGKELTDSISSFARSQHENMERISDLEARTAENLLRRERALVERQKLIKSDSEDPLTKEDKKQFERYKSRRYLDVK